MAAKIFHYTFEEMQGKPAFEFYADADELREMLTQFRADGFIKNREMKLKRKTASSSPSSFPSVWLEAEEGKILGSVCVARDLSDQKKLLNALTMTNEQLIQEIAEREGAEEALRQEKDRAQKYLDIAGIMFFSLNAKGEVTLINRKASEVLGYEQKEFIGKNWFDSFLPVSIKDETRTVFHRLMAGEIEPIERYEKSRFNQRR